MTDFYTKKQRKYWCDRCRIFIEYNKGSIEKHNSSRNHLNNLASDGRYKSIKKKYEQYVNGLNDGDQVGDYHKGESNRMLGRKVVRNNLNDQNSRESSAYLKEIKKSMMKEDVLAMNKQKIQKEKKRIWGVFWDQTYSLPYYYNFITAESVWEKPIDYDGDQEEIDQLINDNNIIKGSNDDTINKNEGIIGKWEKVDDKKSIFGKRRYSEDKEEDKDKEDKVGKSKSVIP